MKKRPPVDVIIADAQPTPDPVPDEPIRPDCAPQLEARVRHNSEGTVKVGDPAALLPRFGTIRMFSLGRLVGDLLEAPADLLNCLEAGVVYEGRIEAIEDGVVIAWLERTK